jgi:hypothetical protein
LLLQQSDQQSLGSFGIAAGLDNLVEDVTVLVNGKPKPMFSATDGNQDAKCQISFRDGFPLRNCLT